MDKVLNKAKLDELIEMSRTYWQDIHPDLAQERCEKMSEYVKENFPKLWHISELIHSILSYYGMKPDATNEDIYKVLEVLGWAVK